MAANRFRPRCLATGIGSLPHTDPRAAFDLVLRYLPAIPLWPQLPRRSDLESMYAQFVEGFPGVRTSNGAVSVDTDSDLTAGLERLYADYLAGNSAPYALSEERAAGFSVALSVLRSSPPPSLVAFKGQVTGPISQGIQMTDRARRPILYDEVLADALAKHLRLVAAEQERQMAEVCSNTITFIDEPYLHAIGSAFIQMSRDQVVASLEEVLGGLKGLSAIHCCANTDFAMLMSTSVDVISFDAYTYAESVALYPEDVKRFLLRGGILAWGIVPNDERALDQESVATLVERLLSAMGLLVQKGLSLDDLLEAAVITPSCGLGTASPQGADRALEMVSKVSSAVRRRFGFGDC